MAYTYDEALTRSVEYFQGDELAAKVFIDKYAARDSGNNLTEDTPTAMHHRLAKEFARVEAEKFSQPLSEDQIFDLFDRFRYVVPQGSVLYGCGNNEQVISLSNCFVISSPEDSYGGILKSDQELVQISKRRGGVGVDLNNLRYKGTATKNSSRTTSGITAWMRRYSHSIREVGQDGRRGALMITLSVHHPDVLDFATIKNNDKEVTGANISVKLTNEFLQAVEDNTEYELRFPVDSTNVVKKVAAREVWKTIVHSAWLRAEPGLLFWDNITSYNAIDCYEEFKTICCNPCAELPLCQFDSCRLLIQNLFSYVMYPFTKGAFFDFDLLWEHSMTAQRLMDDLIDLEIEKIDQIIHKVKNDPEDPKVKQVELDLWSAIKEKCVNGRRTGLGITGEADMLAALGIPYGSDESIRFVEEVHRTQKLASYRSSVEMAKELGPFPIWDREKERNSPFLLRIKEECLQLYEDILHYGRRNIGNLTIAPTGSMSMLTQTTSGIEPLFMLEPYKRRKKINPSDKHARVDFTDPSGDCWQEFLVYHPKVKMWMDITGETDINNSPWKSCTAEELDWKQRVRLQAAAQRHIDHAISSTLNLPEDVTEEQVDEIYRTAWKSGCKGITVYRKNCRTGVLVEHNKPIIIKTNAPDRPADLPCKVFFPSIKGQRYCVAVGLFGDEPYELFASKVDTYRQIDHAIIRRVKAKHYQLISDSQVVLDDLSDKCSDIEEAFCRLISTSLRHGADIRFVVNQLNKTKGDLYSLSHIIARTLKRFIPDGTSVKERCPNCDGDFLRYTEGCISCTCGYSKCS